MISDSKNGLTLLKFEVLAQFTEVRHAVFSRLGGASREPFDSLNTSLGVGDNPDQVICNRNAIMDCFDQPEMMFARQVHGTDVLVFTTGNPPPQQDGFYTGDALTTDMKHRFLTVQTADCQAVLLFDPIHQAVANIHAGWRGSIRNVIGHTISTMHKRFGTLPENLVAAIGPSLGPCCAEFVNYQKEIPDRFWTYRNDTDHFDFWAISQDQLGAAGVGLRNIQTSGICTRCRTDLFYSYRGEGTTGRFASVIGLV